MCQALWGALSFLSSIISIKLGVNVGLCVLGQVRVAVKHKTCTMGVRAHFVPVKPVTYVDTRTRRIVLFTNLVHTIACRSKDLGWDQRSVSLVFAEILGFRNSVVVNNMVERSVGTVVHIDGLLRSGVTPFSAVNFSGMETGSGNHEAAWFSDEVCFDVREVSIHSRLDGGSELGKCWKAAANRKFIRTRKTTTNINDL